MEKQLSIVSIYAYNCVCVRVRVFLHACMPVHVCACMHVLVGVYVHVFSVDLYTSTSHMDVNVMRLTTCAYMHTCTYIVCYIRNI